MIFVCCKGAVPCLDCFVVSVFFILFSLQASVTVKIRGGAISNDLMVAPSHFGCKSL